MLPSHASANPKTCGNAPRSQFLDSFKGILILLVTIGHTVQYMAYGFTNEAFWNDGLFKGIYMFHMPLFMGVAGYLSARSLNTRPAVALIFDRLRSYILPIFVWALLFEFCHRIFQQQTHLPSLPRDVARLAYHSLWFLWALFASTAVIAIARELTRSKWLLAVGSLALVFALPQTGDLHLFKYTFPFFLTGYFLASATPEQRAAIPAQAFFGVSALLTPLVFLLWHRETYIYISGMRFTAENAGNILLRFAGGFSACIFFFNVWRRGFALVPAGLRQAIAIAGRDSIGIYILQIYFFDAFRVLALKHAVPTLGNAWGSLLSIPVGILLAMLVWGIARLLCSRSWGAALLFGRWKSPLFPAVNSSTAKETLPSENRA